MSNKPAIRFANVSKKFMLNHGRSGTIQETLMSIVRPRSRPPKQELWAVKGANFDIPAGEAVGFVGRNGSGKSTMLKLATRIYEPTNGFVQVNGRASALLELGAGFHQELTGRENIYLNGSVLGLSQNEINQCFDSVVAFSELEEFIDMPVKHYSSGMYMRLAFSVAIHVKPDVLFVDEILSVGDQAFQSKCIDRIFEIKQSGVTIVMVSHDLRLLRNLCTRLMWIDNGEILLDDTPQKVFQAYQKFTHERQAEQEALLAKGDRKFKRWGSREVEITDVRFLNQDNQPTGSFNTGDALTVEIAWRTDTPIFAPRFGVNFFRWDGLYIAGPQLPLPASEGNTISGSGTVRYEIEQLPLRPTSYHISAFVLDSHGLQAYDYHDRAYPFMVLKEADPDGIGILDFDAQWRLDDDVVSKQQDAQREAVNE